MTSCTAERVRNGDCPVELTDRAVRRILRQKLDLGVFAEAVDPAEPADLDPAAHRAVARRLAEESVILLANAQQALPLRPDGQLALVGPNADSAEAMPGNYSFTNHVRTPPGTPIGIALLTVLDALTAELPEQTRMVHVPGCAVRSDEETAAATREADVCVAVVGAAPACSGAERSARAVTRRRCGCRDGSRSCDAVLDSGTSVVIVLVTGRPYPLGAFADRAAAVVQAFFPGEEGAAAIASVLTGRLNPRGRLPVSMPRDLGGQPHVHRSHGSVGAARCPTWTRHRCSPSATACPTPPSVTGAWTSPATGWTPAARCGSAAR
ncbi:glycoside hydrolase family 3 C-terminal domain-containing protein [Streptomyces sp. NPDC021212]|uniref:glycoside hydrolase family 3 C-terminal domain-containing protein n=1 Tax=Streptomyces sp. NPDC021212 TaxID=3365118 RepID=UPI003799DC7E